MEILNTLFANDLFALFVVVGSGLLLGQITIKGISLGTSMVLFTALLAGHFGVQLPGVVGSIGLVLFVYCVGIGAGGRFFRAVAREGSALAKLSLLVTAFAALITFLFAHWLKLPADLATGIFAGALTSTPALAAADEALRASGANNLVIGYGIAYPFGVVGVVLFVQLVPRLLGWKMDEAPAQAEMASAEIDHVLVEVTNPNLFGKNISDSVIMERHHCQVSRVWHDNRLVPLRPEDFFEQGQRVLLVGEQQELAQVIDLVGRRDDTKYQLNTDRERRRLLVTSKDFAGKALRELNLTGRYGVVVTRITRLGLTFVPQGNNVIEKHDVLTVVGPEESLEGFAAKVGHRETQIDATDLVSLSLGLTGGVFLGMMPWALPGGEAITLGMAGGPLIVGLLLGHFGRVGGIVGHIPRPTRLLLQELGLVLFLASAGVKGGAQLADIIAQYGVMVFVMGMMVTLLPMLIALPLAQKLFKLSRLQTLGGVCGGMTSTPALGAITAKTDSQVPIISYATAYPVALVIMTLLAKLLVTLML